MKKTLAHLGVLAANLLFGINYSAVKTLLAGGKTGPFGLSTMRILIATFSLVVVFIFSRKNKVSKKDWLMFALCALMGITLNQVLFVKGLSLTFSIHAALLGLVTPILITIISSFLLKESTGWNKILGLGLAVSGCLLLIFSRHAPSASASNPMLGDILIILNSILYTGYFILIKPLTERYGLIQTMLTVFAMGLLFIIPIGGAEFMHSGWRAMTGTEMALMACVGFGGTFLSYLFNANGIKVLGSATSGAYIYSQPLFSAVIAMIFLGEEINREKIIAGVLIFAGLYLSNLKKRTVVAPEAI